jgi:AcrR family transcriptional regulator
MTSEAASVRRAAGRTPRDAVRGEVMGALERMLKRGERFTALNVGAICAEAGTARSAFYVNFEDKVDLLLQVVDAAAHEIALIAEGWLTSDPVLGLDALIDAQERAAVAYRRHAALLAAYAEVAAYDPRVAEYWDAQLASVIRAFAVRIKQGQRAGVVRSDLAPEVCARLIVHGTQAVLREHVRKDSGRGDRALAEKLGRANWSMLHG